MSKSAPIPVSFKDKSKKTMEVVLIGCKRWSPRLRPEVFHARDEDGDVNIHTVPERVGKVLLKKKSSHGIRYFRKARPSDYNKKKKTSQQNEIDLDEEAFSDYDEEEEIGGEAEEEDEVEVEEN